MAPSMPCNEAKKSCTHELFHEVSGTGLVAGTSGRRSKLLSSCSMRCGSSIALAATCNCLARMAHNPNDANAPTALLPALIPRAQVSDAASDDENTARAATLPAETNERPPVHHLPDVTAYRLN